MNMKKPDEGRFGTLGSLAAFLDGFLAFTFGSLAGFPAIPLASPFRLPPTLSKKMSSKCTLFSHFRTAYAVKPRHILLANLGDKASNSINGNKNMRASNK